MLYAARLFQNLALNGKNTRPEIPRKPVKNTSPASIIHAREPRGAHTHKWPRVSEKKKKKKFINSQASNAQQATRRRKQMAHQRSPLYYVPTPENRREKKAEGEKAERQKSSPPRRTPSSGPRGRARRRGAPSSWPGSNPPSRCRSCAASASGESARGPSPPLSQRRPRRSMARIPVDQGVSYLFFFCFPRSFRTLRYAIRARSCGGGTVCGVNFTGARLARILKQTGVILVGELCYGTSSVKWSEKMTTLVELTFRQLKFRIIFVRMIVSASSWMKTRVLSPRVKFIMISRSNSKKITYETPLANKIAILTEIRCTACCLPEA